ncbi:hypothetical protein C5167_047872 [Papaver somniferum]|uniref:Uncharacterized protein n=1 Tax=Papaver somniferum TaxID=3469 RepID=A0A4Y7LJE6_PAPSO|nr:hypothetical protein C5167_047872 [Papaver somniferum]
MHSHSHLQRNLQDSQIGRHNCGVVERAELTLEIRCANDSLRITTELPNWTSEIGTTLKRWRIEKHHSRGTENPWAIPLKNILTVSSPLNSLGTTYRSMCILQLGVSGDHKSSCCTEGHVYKEAEPR